jgi:hypothetical protein
MPWDCAWSLGGEHLNSSEPRCWADLVWVCISLVQAVLVLLHCSETCLWVTTETPMPSLSFDGVDRSSEWILRLIWDKHVYLQVRNMTASNAVTCRVTWRWSNIDLASQGQEAWKPHADPACSHPEVCSCFPRCGKGLFLPRVGEVAEDPGELCNFQGSQFPWLRNKRSCSTRVFWRRWFSECCGAGFWK